MSENFDTFNRIEDFAVNLVEPNSRENENLVWSSSNTSLEETLIQDGTASSQGQCGLVRIVTDTASVSLDFERSICGDGDLLPLCMVQSSESRRRRGEKRNKKRNKRKQLRWKQSRSRKRNRFYSRPLGGVREGRQTEAECPTPAVDQCLAMTPVAALIGLLPSVFVPGISVGGAGAAVPPPAAPAAPAAPPAPAAPEVGSVVAAAGQLTGAALANALSSLNNGVTNFNMFMEMFDKSYDSQQERVQREEMFLQNMQMIDVTTDRPRPRPRFTDIFSRLTTPSSWLERRHSSSELTLLLI